MAALKTGSPQLSRLLERRLAELDVTPTQFARNANASYDHFRKVFNGDLFPGKSALKIICEAAGLEFESTLALVNADRFQAKFAVETIGTDKKLAALQSIWSSLSKRDRDELFDLAQTKVRLKADHSRLARAA